MGKKLMKTWLLTIDNTSVRLETHLSHKVLWPSYSELTPALNLGKTYYPARFPSSWINTPCRKRSTECFKNSNNQMQ